MRRFVFYLIGCMLALAASRTLSAQKTLYPNTLLWRISGKDLTKPSYLYGTMHLQDRRIFQFSDSLYYFLEHADGFAMEINPDDLMEAFLGALGKPDTSGLLKDVMDEKEFKKIAGDLEVQFGVSADKITRKQAWLYRQGWKKKSKTKPDDMDVAMDTYLYNIARRQGKWVGGIEDVEDQLGLLARMGDEYDGEDLLAGMKAGDASVEKLIRMYAAQDLNKLNDWCVALDSVWRDGLLIRRNKKMTRRIDSLAHIRSSFFAVGAAHLPGEFGLIQLLQEAGYRVDAVVSKKKVAPEQYSYQEKELPWYKVENEEKTYEAFMPGKAIEFSPNSEAIKLKMYADLGTGIYYFITGIPVPAGRSSDSLLALMAKNYARTGNSMKPSQITFDGKKGLETTLSTSGYYYRLRLIAEDGQVMMMMAGSEKKNLLFHREAERFYQSLKTYPASIAKRNSAWYRYTDEDRAVEVSFPAKPSFSKEQHQNMSSEGAEGWEFTNQVYFDVINQVWYMLAITETKPGFYITNEDDMLSAPKRNMEKGGNATVVKYETGEFSGYPCMWLDGRYNENGIRLKMFNVVRGNRSYCLMVISEDNSDTARVNRFFTSLKFNDFKKQGWKTYRDSTYTTFAPAPPDTAVEQSTDNSSITTFYDKMSGFSFQVNTEALSPYFWTANDDTLFAKEIKEYVADGDSILTSVKISNGAAGGIEYMIRMGNDGKNSKRVRLLINKDTVYSLSLIAPQRFQGVKEYDRFFSEFRFNQYGRKQDLYTNKAQKLLGDLSSPDSATREKAKDFINAAPFTRSDLPLLHQALLLPYSDFENRWNSTHERLVDKVVEFADESTIDFVQQSYASLRGEKEVLKYSLLRGLAKIPTPKSYFVLKELLVKQIPSKGNPAGLGYNISDNLQQAKAILPELLPLVSDSLFADELVTICNNLLDSSAIHIDAIRPYEAMFLKKAQYGLDTMSRSDGEDSWQLHSWISLLGRFNDAASNQVLQQFAASGFINLQYSAATELIKNGQAVSPVIIDKIAADRNYRLSLYELCKELGKLKLFPARYNNQRSIAESELYSYASDDAEPSKMEYIGERTRLYKGVKQKFYLFQIQYTYDESLSESYLGVAGPYPLSSTAIITEADATGMYQEAFNPKQVDVQLKSYLDELEAYAEENESDE